jgi:hypothetical protein
MSLYFEVVTVTEETVLHLSFILRRRYKWSHIKRFTCFWTICWWSKCSNSHFLWIPWRCCHKGPKSFCKILIYYLSFWISSVLKILNLKDVSGCQSTPPLVF